MRGKQKPTPLEKAAADFQALINSMIASGTPEAEKSRAAIQRSIECFMRGDLKGCDAEMDLADAHQSAAIAASAKGKPSVKRASAAGKASGAARRKRNDHAKLKKEYISLRKKGFERSDAMREIFRLDWVASLTLTNSQIYKITADAEDAFSA
jgi:hypothetical protein